jgi:hypothetical protein
MKKEKKIRASQNTGLVMNEKRKKKKRTSTDQQAVAEMRLNRIG